MDPRGHLSQLFIHRPLLWALPSFLPASILARKWCSSPLWPSPHYCVGAGGPGINLITHSTPGAWEAPDELMSEF